MGSKDKASNKTQDLKGKVKEAAGSATGNDDLRRKGKADQTKAALKDSGEKVKDAASHVKDALMGRQALPDRASPLFTSDLMALPGPTSPVTTGWTMEPRTIVGSLRSPRLLARWR